MRILKSTISGWGNYPTATSFLMRPEKYKDIKINDHFPLIARGYGRSYGDAAINNDHYVMLMQRMNRMLKFESETGLLTAEAGTSLAEILEIFVPRGWFLPVTPGTKYCSLGGCVAADVHGKNHHVDGTFSKHVRAIELMLPDGTTQRCSPENQKELFWATVGGMGLTGIITELTLQLIPVESAYMRVQHFPAKNLEEAMDILSKDSQQFRYSVAWIDCLARGNELGRSIVMNGNHAKLDELPKSIKNPLNIKEAKKHNLPFNLPSGALNSLTIKAFNSLYYRFQSGKKEPFIIDYDRYFYPLDAITNWNRLYGKKGFVQYQVAFPTETSLDGLKKLLEELSLSNRPSFLAVLKKFGPQGEGLLSFPFEGYTLALDIPNSDAQLMPFLDHLDDIVLQYKGRIYLAKDARLSAERFRQMYPRLEEFQKLKSKIDPQSIISSDLSRRLNIQVAT